eukprot:CAMPEP_0119299816 /NCGR_PEP_ID=MMETSP1333-20130426/1852_1 /TAXON_ID=418940 /ORGANISM="Scyphosphaera apsteinii, Strain RCC1455" /LENGTH=166 /DNA_ID=CAMNT_0007301379 /DNA_START=238 /DNA_END=735 /DNA_ORIENTATION=+
MTTSSFARRRPVDSIQHPDKRLYPWLSPTRLGCNSSGANLFLTYEHADLALCCELATLEVATALARSLNRTLVLPRRLCPGGRLDVYFELSHLRQLVHIMSSDQYDAYQWSENSCDSVVVCYSRAAHCSPWIEAKPQRSASGKHTKRLKNSALELISRSDVDVVSL